MSALSNADRGPATAEDFREMIARLDVIADDIVLLTRERDEAQATVARLGALFAGGPDTACRTVWHDGVECCVVPVFDLSEAFGDRS